MLHRKALGRTRTRKGSTVPESLLNALDVILAKVPLCNLLFTNGDTIPCESERGAVASLVEDEGKG